MDCPSFRRSRHARSYPQQCRQQMSDPKFCMMNWVSFALRQRNTGVWIHRRSAYPRQRRDRNPDSGRDHLSCWPYRLHRWHLRRSIQCGSAKTSSKEEFFQFCRTWRQTHLLERLAYAGMRLRSWENRPRWYCQLNRCCREDQEQWRRFASLLRQAWNKPALDQWSEFVHDRRGPPRSPDDFRPAISISLV